MTDYMTALEDRALAAELAKRVEVCDHRTSAPTMGRVFTAEGAVELSHQGDGTLKVFVTDPPAVEE